MARHPTDTRDALASQAAIGEILVTDEAATAASVPDDGLERRHVSLKGHPVDAVVLATSGGRPAVGC